MDCIYINELDNIIQYDENSNEYIFYLEVDNYVIDVLRHLGSNSRIKDQLNLDLPRDNTYINGHKILSYDDIDKLLPRMYIVKEAQSIIKNIVCALLTQTSYGLIYDILCKLFPNMHVIQENSKRNINVTWLTNVTNSPHSYIKIEQNKNFGIYDTNLKQLYRIQTFCDIEPFSHNYFIVSFKIIV